MAKLFSVKLANLENEMKDLKLNTSSTSSTKIIELEKRIDETKTLLTSRLNSLDNTIHQMVNELSEILNKHANMIIDLQKQINSK